MDDENRICPNQSHGQHIVVRCSGCNSIHSTKNIGDCNSETKRVHLARNLFDIYGTYCLCTDTSKFPLIHDCKIDDNLEYAYKRLDLRHGQHVAKTPEARTVLQSWWKRFSESKPELGTPTQEELDSLVKLESDGVPTL